MQKIILIVGPSGVGKDTLLCYAKKILSKDDDYNFVKRHITRKPDENESNFYLDKESFQKKKDEGYFVSSWEAHENYYGIAKDQIKNAKNIISISRGAIEDFEAVFDNVTTLSITVSQKILYGRLKNRGRESEEAIQKRLKRAKQPIKARKILEFDNSDKLEKSRKKFLMLLMRDV